MERANIRTKQRLARRAGFLYLLIALIAPIGLMVVPGRLVVARDAAATAENLRNAGWLLRLGIASELGHQILGVFLVLVLYRLFNDVDKGLARQMVIFGSLVSVPIVFVNVLNEIAALALVREGGFLTVFDRRQLDAMAYLCLHVHGQGISVASIFWGLWLFPFGLLVIRSGFIARAFGFLLLVAGAAYLAAAFATLIMPRYASLVGTVALPLEAAEVPIIVWLVIRGARSSGPPGGALSAPG